MLVKPNAASIPIRRIVRIQPAQGRWWWIEDVHTHRTRIAKRRIGQWSLGHCLEVGRPPTYTRRERFRGACSRSRSRSKRRVCQRVRDTSLTACCTCTRNEGLNPTLLGCFSFEALKLFSPAKEPEERDKYPDDGAHANDDSRNSASCDARAARCFT
jgi:hypothetical protein